MTCDLMPTALFDKLIGAIMHFSLIQLGEHYNLPIYRYHYHLILVHPSDSCNEQQNLFVHHSLHLPTTFAYHFKHMSPPPAVTLTAPQSPTRARSVSQPIREGVVLDFFSHSTATDSSSLGKSARSAFSRSQSTNNVLKPVATSSGMSLVPAGPPTVNRVVKGRARSSSLVTVTEVGGDEPEVVVDRLGVGTNENAAWVNAPGEISIWFDPQDVLTVL